MKLSILDQSVIRAGGNAKEALDETLALAQYAETLGYHRFWLSEHHATYSLAGMSASMWCVQK
jgi:alkanesulfonate monooxygenase SsuD/methylene tetrahydromethanopterin reductase-like flavin-dependent oxidoreductase (luciferase family)